MHLTNCLDWYWLAMSNLSPHTRDDYSRTFGRLAAFLGNDAEIEKITHRDIQRFLAHIETTHHLGRKTLCNAWIALASLWRWANREINIPNIIAGKISIPAHSPPIIEPYSADDIERLLHAAETYTGYDPANRHAVEAHLPPWRVARNKAIILVLFDAGLRRQELADLNVEDYSARNGRLIVRHGKGDKPRTTHVGHTTRRALAQYLIHRTDPQPSDPLFADANNGRLNGNSIYTMIARLGKRAGIANAGCHRFRHSCATEMLRNGASERAVQTLLGHESPEMTRRYAKFVEADLEHAHELASPVDNRYAKKRAQRTK